MSHAVFKRNKQKLQKSRSKVLDDNNENYSVNLMNVNVYLRGRYSIDNTKL